SQDDDVTYSEVRIRDSAPPPAGNSNGPAVCVSTKSTGSSSHPYRLAAVCLGLLCVLLLTAIIALCVHYTGDQSCSEIRRNYSSLTEENAKLQRGYSSLTEENTKLQRNYSSLNNNVSMCTKKLQEEKSHILSALAKEIRCLQKYCNSQSGVLVCNSCPEGWELWRSKCYYFSTERKSWTESRFNCLQQGGDLVIIESKEEQEFIKGRMTLTAWIGLQLIEKKKWIWVDGSPLKEGSMHYLHSNWCTLELRPATHWLLLEQEDIMILLEKIPPFLLSAHHRLARLVKTRTYLLSAHHRLARLVKTRTYLLSAHHRLARLVKTRTYLLSAHHRLARLVKTWTYLLSAHHRLARLVKTWTYLNWPQDSEPQAMFWDKIRAKLGPTEGGD
ncbi:hypothetical protein JZ751_015821, partial [Albula glossodonta]